MCSTDGAARIFLFTTFFSCHLILRRRDSNSYQTGPLKDALPAELQHRSIIISHSLAVFLTLSVVMLYLGCLTDDEQSRARAKVPTDLDTMRNLSRSASLRRFLNFLASSDVSMASSSASSWWLTLTVSSSRQGGTQTLSSTEGKTFPAKSRNLSSTETKASEPIAFQDQSLPLKGEVLR